MPRTAAPSPHLRFVSAPDESLAGSQLTIDLGALADNYHLMAEKSGKATCSAVIKADAYGIGLEQAATALWAAGCRTFFVALPSEGARARALLPDAMIYVLNGFVGDDTARSAAFYQKHALRPVLGSYEEIDLWQTCCNKAREASPLRPSFRYGHEPFGTVHESGFQIVRKVGFRSTLLHSLSDHEPSGLCR